MLKFLNGGVILIDLDDCRKNDKGVYYGMYFMNMFIRNYFERIMMKRLLVEGWYGLLERFELRIIGVVFIIIIVEKLV